MNRLFQSLFLLTLAVIFTSCSDDSSKRSSDSLHVTALPDKTLYFNGNGGETSYNKITIEASGRWTASTNVDWAEISPDSGDKGKTEISVAARPNDTYDSRTGQIFITCGTKADTLTITQAAKDALVIAERDYTVEPAGGTISVIATTSRNSLKVEPADNWVHYIRSRALETITLELQVDCNSTGIDRKTSVDFIAGDIKQTITISQRSNAEELEAERAALVAFYNATNGDRWKDESGVYSVTNGNWLSDKPVSEWQHVTTDKNGYVTELGFSAENLRGFLPDELGNLRHLKRLSIMANRELGGVIPESLGNCTELEYLYIEESSIEGSIPESLKNCKKLKILLLSSNRLSGPIPDFFDNFSDLVAFAACRNQLTGSIPESLGSCKFLQFVRLDDNQLSGTIPTSLANCTDITSCDLSSNLLSGGFPAEIKKPWRFEVASNLLEGPLPEALTGNRDAFAANWGAFIFCNNFDLTGVRIPGIEFFLTDIDGKHINSGIYKTNRLTMLFQWSSSCAIAEGITFKVNDLYKKYHDKGLEVVGLTHEAPDYIRGFNFSFRNVKLGPDMILGIDGVDPMEEINIYRPDIVSVSEAGRPLMYPTWVYPTITLIDNEGYVVFSDIINNPNDLDDFIAGYLEKSK